MIQPINTPPERVKRLMERFFDGATSNAEERELYAYFRRPDLPAEWLAYRDLFAYFEQGLTDAALPPVAATPGRLHRLWRRAMAVAAVAVALLATGATGWHHARMERWMHTYEGSYRIEHGRKITDLRDLRPYIEQSLASARQLRHEARAIEQAQARQLDELRQSLTDGVDDPELRRVIEEVCSQP